MNKIISYFLLCLLSTQVTTDSPIQTTKILQNNYNPILFLVYKVNLADFQTYIDPRFIVATFQNDAYIIIHFANTSEASPLGGSIFATFPNIDIYTIVNYQNKLRRETLLTELKLFAGALLCQPTSTLPYGCPYNNDTDFTLNEQSHTYQYYSELYRPTTQKTALVQLTVTFNPNDRIDYSINGDPPSTLASFALSQTTNGNLIQTFYSKQKPIEGQPIAKGTYTTYYSPVYSCTINSIQSNFITAAVGPIQGLDEAHPALCLYAASGQVNYTDVSYV